MSNVIEEAKTLGVQVKAKINEIFQYNIELIENKVSTKDSTPLD